MLLHHVNYSLKLKLRISVTTGIGLGFIGFIGDGSGGGRLELFGAYNKQECFFRALVCIRRAGLFLVAPIG
ncbi:hypothetical protein DERF_011134 [Dermatophagoides farinae]|uniref:Uncharacterized protein n=1 Tax=Dermatophagoides farinae TaxID=6954 RepID=A0A922HVK3_DERFA|nr:hypothetical protein DERF_011134 [Dermatophagoides farinae]